MVDCFYRLLDRFPGRNGFLYKYTYKILKVILNVLFPLFYRTSKPRKGEAAVETVVVSFTSFPARINTVWETALTLLDQSVTASHVILWLAKSQFRSKEELPGSLLRLEQYGLEIRFCEDLRSHKKYYFAMREYPDAVIVTADDDVFYPSDWLENLLNKHQKYPKNVVCYWAHRIRMRNGKICHYEEWDSCVGDGDKKPSKMLLPVGYAGILYPPHSLNDRVFDKEAVKRYCLSADDLWLKAMAYLNGVDAIQVFENPVKMFAVIRAQDVALFDINVGQNQNDTALCNIVSAYDEFEAIRPEWMDQRK